MRVSRICTNAFIEEQDRRGRIDDFWLDKCLVWLGGREASNSVVASIDILVLRIGADN